jgi:hypothetical protein
MSIMLNKKKKYKNIINITHQSIDPSTAMTNKSTKPHIPVEKVEGRGSSTQLTSVK